MFCNFQTFDLIKLQLALDYWPFLTVFEPIVCSCCHYQTWDLVKLQFAFNHRQFWQSTTIFWADEILRSGKFFVFLAGILKSCS
jgi:hypothetical protein